MKPQSSKSFQKPVPTQLPVSVVHPHKQDLSSNSVAESHRKNVVVMGNNSEPVAVADAKTPPGELRGSKKSSSEVLERKKSDGGAPSGRTSDHAPESCPAMVLSGGSAGSNKKKVLECGETVRVLASSKTVAQEGAVASAGAKALPNRSPLKSPTNSFGSMSGMSRQSSEPCGQPRGTLWLR